MAILEWLECLTWLHHWRSTVTWLSFRRNLSGSWISRTADHILSLTSPGRKADSLGCYFLTFVSFGVPWVILSSFMVSEVGRRSLHDSEDVI